MKGRIRGGRFRHVAGTPERGVIGVRGRGLVGRGIGRALLPVDGDDQRQNLLRIPEGRVQGVL